MARPILKSLFKLLVSQPNISKTCRATLATKPPKGGFKAAFLKQVQVPLVIECKEREKLKKDQVRLKVKFCSVNSVDCITFRDGSKNKQYPFVPGYELSGEVIELGKDVPNEDLRIGETVAALSLSKLGGFAEECIVDAKDCWRLPSNVNAKDAAVLIYGHSLAIYAFSHLCKLNEHEPVLISAGPAGLGLAAVDVAANIYGAKVIAVTDTEDRTELVRNRGAFQTIKFHNKIENEVLKITSNHGMNVIYDAVGDYMMEKVANCAGIDCKILQATPIHHSSIPAPPPNTQLTLVDMYDLMVRRHDLFRTMVSDTLEMANQGAISAHISATFPLEDINKAIEYIERKECTGKVLIEVDD